MQQTTNCIDITAHLGLAHLCANRFRNRGIVYEELYSAACLGLVKAAHGFDAARGVCFSTYAVPVILGEIRRLFRDGGTVTVSRRLKERASQAHRLCEQMRQENGCEPTIQMLAHAMGLSETDAAEALCAGQPVVSLTACTEEGTQQLDVPVPSPEEAMHDRLALKQVLALLSEQERTLLHLRYSERLTQQAVATRMGMTQVQVSRKEKKLLCFLREELLR